MTSFIDAKFGIYPQALQLQEKRAEIIAGNLAHRNTPGYKARDIDPSDFKAALKDIQDQSNLSGKQANNSQTQTTQTGNFLLNNLKYRTAVQPSPDGNTVDPSVENAAFAETNVRYLATLNILTERMRTLSLAIKGS